MYLLNEITKIFMYLFHIFVYINMKIFFHQSEGVPSGVFWSLGATG